MNTNNTTKRTKNGGITFKPLSSGWYRCNQGKREKTRNPTLYRETWEKEKKNEKRQEDVSTMKSFTIKSNGDWNCPYCVFLNKGATVHVPIRCAHCNKFALPIARSVKTGVF